jgi:anaerobic dimethyl sulfoxide reductase subunit C (anchor subunit)
MAVGMFVISGLVAIVLPSPNLFTEGLLPILVLTSTLLTLVLGAVVATRHLNSPLKARFSLTNLRDSWLSREAFLGGGFGLWVSILLLRCWLGSDFVLLDITITLIGIACGLGLVYSISRLYMLRTVPAWNHKGTPATFFTSSILLGTAGILFLWLIAIYWDDGYAINQILGPMLIISGLLIFLLISLQFGIFVFTVIYLNSQGGKATESVRLLWRSFKGVTFWRWATAFTAIGLLLFQRLVFRGIFSLFAVFALVVLSEILGRYLFYGFYRREGI